MWLGRRVLQWENQKSVRSEEIISMEGCYGRTEASQGIIWGFGARQVPNLNTGIQDTY